MLIGWKAAVHDPRIASFRYRVAEPVAALSARGHDVELFSPDRAPRYDLVVFAKSYKAPDQAIARAVKARGGQVALDLCDNHFYNPYDLPRYVQARADLLAMIALADRLIVSTPVLGAIVRAEAGLGFDPQVVGDVAERILLPPRPPRAGRSLLWFGSHGSPNAPSGMNDLGPIAGVLQAQYARTPFTLVVASNDEAKFAALAPRLGVPARYVAWTAEGFPALLADADAVVIPLSDNPFVAAKTHNRLTAALWPGVPVVADAIDSYRAFAPFAWLDDWAEGLRTTLEEPAAARARAGGAAGYIDAHWTMAQLAPQWEHALGLVGSAPPAPGPAPSPARRGATRPSLYQGALDVIEPDRVTGWARLISDPAGTVRVTLEEEGRVVAETRAHLPRPDLAAAGFRHHACGFVLDVPSDWLDGSPRRFTVSIDGLHVIEESSASFRPDAAARQPLPEDPVAEQLRALADLVPALAAGEGDPRRAREEVRLQARLADELEVLNDAVEQVRRIAARIVLAAGGADEPQA